MDRGPRSAALLAVVTIALLFASALVPSMARGAPAAPPSLGSAAGTAESPAHAISTASTVAQPYAGALRSLARGEGPAAGVPWSCTSNDASSFACGATPNAAVRSTPAASPAARPLAHNPYPLNWTNQTGHLTGIDGAPVDGSGYAVAAYDPLLGALVLFGDNRTLNPSANTWEYFGNEWINETFYLEIFGGLPPPLAFATLTWVPEWAGVILTGGIEPGGHVSTSTWLFNGEWVNETGNIAGAPTDALLSNAAYDSAYHALVLVNGCAGASCLGTVAQTWMLLDTLFGWGWFDVTSTLPQTLGAAGAPDNGGIAAQMAYDALDGYMVFFGGERISGFHTQILNDTWILNNTGWWNISSSSIGCFFIFCFYPTYSVAGSMTWDGQINSIVMFTGFDQTDTARNVTWVFQLGVWFPADLFQNANLTEPPNVTFAAMPTNSSDIAPVMIGGVGCSPVYACASDAWVLEIPPHVTAPIASANPAEAGAHVSFQASLLQGTGSGPYVTSDFYDFELNSAPGSYYPVNTNVGSTALGGSFDYASYVPGTYFVVVEVVDFFGVPGFNDSLIQINATVSATPLLTANPGEAGTPVSFAAGAANGVGPYAYLWGFGDGSATSTQVSPAHTYAAPGTYHGWVNVTDSLGLYDNATFTATVYPALSASIVPLPSPTDVGIAVGFQGNGQGGFGAYHYDWAFGDGGSATVQNPTHSYATAKTYTVYLNVTDGLGFVTSKSVALKVNDPMSVGAVAPSTKGPDTYTHVSFSVPVSLGTAPYSYQWSFGDGSTSTSASPSHTFSSAGNYTITVLVTDAAGAHTTKTSYLVVKQPTLVEQLTHPPGLYGLVGAIVAIVAIAAALLVLRRRKKGGAAAPAPTPATPPSGAAGTPESTPPASSGGTPPSGPS